MTRFHLASIVPPPGDRSLLHGLYGYREVIDTLRWGLDQLGHEVSVGQNTFRADHVNVVFGVQVLPHTDLLRLPDDTIVYNFEQIGGLTIDELKPLIRTVADRFRIWDYSEHNIETWQRIGAKRNVAHVPVGWAPVLRHIVPADPQDIDVLFYGSPSSERFAILTDLCNRGVKCIFVCGLYGSARDELIARSKLVLNLNKHQSRIFEIVRVSYLLANAKAVVADRAPDSYVEPDMEDALAFATRETIVATCERLLDDRAAREALEQRGLAAIERRPIAPPLAAALAKTGFPS